ncbi:LppP/LprE family lipoprotein [Mycobacterium simiae]|uniref:LppP/LprE family lipoprotein n=1 Tax=Mycobacterium simiae TaxID=1784 RepID=A0A5B1BMF2_MYCSI|nr:LppP/LprE family lipoprotein [Mycobacterium simiae]KAA1249035.1 LppP/LprE family lipoprotein [Mycobacterium simiae]
MRIVSLAALVAMLCAVNLMTAPAHATPTCGVNLSAPEVQAAVNTVPNLPESYAWDRNPRSFDPSSNYNPCATLSVVIISVAGATGSSPDLALLFHKGSYLGIATSKAYPFTSLNAAQTTDDTVALSYKDGRNVCTACPGPLTTVRYQWQGDHVVMLDPAPVW